MRGLVPSNWYTSPIRLIINQVYFRGNNKPGKVNYDKLPSIVKKWTKLHHNDFLSTHLLLCFFYAVFINTFTSFLVSNHLLWSFVFFIMFLFLLVAGLVLISCMPRFCKFNFLNFFYGSSKKTKRKKETWYNSFHKE